MPTDEQLAIHVRLAKDLFGWGPREGHPVRWRNAKTSDGYSRDHLLPFFTWDMRDAWLIVEELESQGLSFKLEHHPELPRRYSAQIDGFVRGHYVAKREHADSMPMAICGAALALVGQL